MSPAQWGCPRAAPGRGCHCPIWGLSHSTSTAPRMLVRNSMSHMEVQKHQSHGCQNMTFSSGTRHFLQGQDLQHLLPGGLCREQHNEGAQCTVGCTRGCGAHRTRQPSSLLLESQQTLTKWRSCNLHWLSTLSTQMHLSFWFLYPNPSKSQTEESADRWHRWCHRHHLLGLCHSPSLLGKGKASMPIKNNQ